MPKINLGKVVGDKGDSFTYEDFTPEQLNGITPKIFKGNVTTLNPDQNATVDIRNDGLNNYIDFGIPRGKNGSEIKNIYAENVSMADGNTLESTMTNIITPTFDDSTQAYETLTAANAAAETTSNKIKSGENIFTTLSNMKKSFSAIVQGLKILGTNVGNIRGITSDLNSESDYIAASSKAVSILNGNLPEFAIVDALAPSEADGNTYFNLPNSSWNANNTVCLKIMAYNEATKSWYDNRLYALLINRLQFTAESAGQERYYLNQPVKIFLMKFR